MNTSCSNMALDPNSVHVKMLSNGRIAASSNLTTSFQVDANDLIWIVPGTEERFDFQTALDLRKIVNFQFALQHDMGMSPFDCTCDECEAMVGRLVLSFAAAHELPVEEAVDRFRETIET